MIRAMLAMLLVGLAMVPAAAGASVPLRDDLAATEVALAGPDVLIVRELFEENQVQLVAVARTGGPARSVLSVDSASPVEGVSASDVRVAWIVEMRDRRGETTEWRVYSGPPTGPLKLVRRTPERGPRTWVPALVDVGRRLPGHHPGETRRADRRTRALRHRRRQRATGARPPDARGGRAFSP